MCNAHTLLWTEKQSIAFQLQLKYHAGSGRLVVPCKMTPSTCCVVHTVSMTKLPFKVGHSYCVYIACSWTENVTCITAVNKHKNKCFIKVLALLCCYKHKLSSILYHSKSSKCLLVQYLIPK